MPMRSAQEHFGEANKPCPICKEPLGPIPVQGRKPVPGWGFVCAQCQDVAFDPELPARPSDQLPLDLGDVLEVFPFAGPSVERGMMMTRRTPE